MIQYRILFVVLKLKGTTEYILKWGQQYIYIYIYIFVHQYLSLKLQLNGWMLTASGDYGLCLTSDGVFSVELLLQHAFPFNVPSNSW